MRRAPAVALVVLALVSGFGLAGCEPTADNVRSDGPLTLTQSPDKVCLPIPQYNPASYGVDLPTKLTTAVTIESISLLNPVNITLVSSSIMPIGPHLSLLAQEFPPGGQMAKDWSRSIDAIGVTILPGQHREIVLELRDAAGVTGTASGVRVTYTAKGTKYRSRSHLAVEIRAAASC